MSISSDFLYAPRTVIPPGTIRVLHVSRYQEQTYSTYFDLLWICYTAGTENNDRPWMTLNGHRALCCTIMHLPEPTGKI